jgi:murein L,D-transpeptidase YcbB/YkuD
MADINKSLVYLFECEYGNIAAHALERAAGESFLTYKGLQERDDADFAGWAKIHAALDMYGGDKKMAGVYLESDYALYKTVVEYYKTHYWDKCRLDEVTNQHIADEIFIAAVLYSPLPAIKMAQRVVGVADDGIIGEKTLAALNSFDATVFDKVYDNEEIHRAELLCAKNPKLAINYRGWVARARAV